MSADWIKMRCDLFTHPKVVRISSALKVDTLRTVGGLMSAWCLFDAHSVDGRLPGYTSQTLDDHLRWLGFSDAMKAVEWLNEDEEGLSLPRFDTHNGASAKRRAQDADRKRLVRNLSALEADEMRTREEKKRDKKKNEKKEQPPAASFVIPDWIRSEVWQGFAEMRKKKRAPLTVRACAMVITELIKLRSAGHEPNAVLDQSTRNSWTDVYAIKEQHHANGRKPSKTSVVERIADQIAANRAARGSVIEGELADP